MYRDQWEVAARIRVIDEAKTWLRTPFHHEARVKGAGVDCAMLLAEVYAAVGQIPRLEPDHYSAQWHLHKSEEKYLPWIEKFADEIQGPPSPGDIAIFKFGRAFSHAAIVVAWPTVIHAWIGTTVEYCDASKQPLQFREVKFFTLKEWKS